MSRADPVGIDGKERLSGDRGHSRQGTRAEVRHENVARSVLLGMTFEIGQFVRTISQKPSFISFFQLHTSRCT